MKELWENILLSAATRSGFRRLRIFPNTWCGTETVQCNASGYASIFMKGISLGRVTRRKKNKKVEIYQGEGWWWGRGGSNGKVQSDWKKYHRPPMKWKVNIPITLCNESKNSQTVSAAIYSREVIITQWVNENVLNGEIKLDSFEAIKK